ncbi:CUAEP/CCAEP-tail radical SAM (seleno)protein [Nonomuraea sp. NPDC050783]|uniref:CUAEP/CCAEP-tail radical SAM (seleno)protein n=1 Tax=Nonomuraea sp. NPDC050783 TaxID=3154634 RepID=UPI003467B665
MNIVLLSTYELGHQPFGLASPAAWLRKAGATVSCLDLAVEELDESRIRAADLIAVYVPMHTATRLATPLTERLRKLNPDAHLCFYGLYAPVNEAFLRKLGAQTVIGGEFEEGLLSLATRLAAGDRPAASPEPQPEPLISLSRQRFLVPDRRTLPLLDKYAYLTLGDGQRRVVGYTEATRGCKHLCRHCPIVPVYNGRFRVVQRDVVLQDIDAQVAAGAQHITFGDPDFFNGPAHALGVVKELHERHPELTYDVTIKVEHLIKQAEHLPTLRDTGCLFVTSAVESVDDRILTYFDKLHTRDDFIRVAGLFREAGLGLNPTFVTFTPWTTPENYLDLLTVIAEQGLTENIAPIQYAIRLLIPRGSRLLELPEVSELVAEFDEPSLAYPWAHPDPRVDRLYDEVMEAVKRTMRAQATRTETFAQVWRVAAAACRESTGRRDVPLEPPAVLRGGNLPVPRLSEPWYCCAEPTEEQLTPSV